MADLSKLGGAVAGLIPSANQPLGPVNNGSTQNRIGNILIAGINASSKILAFDASGKFALNSAFVNWGVTANQSLFSMEIDGRMLVIDGVASSNPAFEQTTLYSGDTSNGYVHAPLIVESNIKIWLERLTATSATLTLNLITLE